MTHQYMVIKGDDSKCRVVMILSEHDTHEEATAAMLAAMNKESDKELKREVSSLRKCGIKAVTVKEAVKDMTPEELERFLEERQRKFVNPMLEANINAFEKKSRDLKPKRIK